MEEFNLPVIALSALVPLLIGFIWYHPKVFGAAWMRAAGVSDENIKGTYMALVFGLTYLLSFFFAFSLQFMVIHQFHIFSILANEPGIMEAGSESNTVMMDFMSKYGNNFRTFKHGAFHGLFAGLFIATPILAVNALYERKSFKYIAINAGFWIVSMILMGGILCAYC